MCPFRPLYILADLLCKLEEIIQSNLTGNLSYQYIKSTLSREFGTKEFERFKLTVQARILEAENIFNATRLVSSEGCSLAIDIADWMQHHFTARFKIWCVFWVCFIYMSFVVEKF